MPSVNPGQQTGKVYWRSLEELADTPQFREFMHNEFPAGAMDMLDGGERRHFLKIMGASMALAGLGLSGCRRWPDEKIVPYARRPEGTTPGVPQSFATCAEQAGVAAGLLVTSYDGRPIKIEGNPDHPINRGATSATQQAHVLDLYDPDRSRTVLHAGATSSWGAFASWAADSAKTLKNARGNGLAILSEATGSPSVLAMRRRLLEAYPNAKWHEYEAINNDETMRGSAVAFGAPYRAQYSLENAQVIVSLDSDFLCNDPASMKHSRAFAAGRRATDRAKSMNRLYVFESGLSLTGANADERAAVRSSDIAAVAGWLASRLAEGAGAALDQAGSSLSPRARAVLDRLHTDLTEHRGASVVMAGPRQPAEVHALVHLLNEALGNVGKTVRYTAEGSGPRHVESMQALCDAIAGNQVGTLLILGGNPVYNAPADLDFAGKLASVQTSVHLSDYEDETSQACTWHVNRAHGLESWGDGRAWDGTVSIRQPLIQPLFDGHTSIEVLAAMTGDELSLGYDIVRRTFSEMTGGSEFEAMWRRTLHDGVLAGSALTLETPPVDRDAVGAAVDAFTAQRSAPGGIEIVFTPDPFIYDGRYANNGWLQEVPDQIGKLTWDNAAHLSPHLAEQLGVGIGDMISITVGGTSVEVPVLVIPGPHDESITVALGYGRRFEGRVCSGAGVDVYPLRRSDAMGCAAADVSATGGSYPLACTQDHHAVDSVAGKGTEERLPTLVREADVREYREHPDFARHRTHVVHRLSLWAEDLDHQDEGGAAPYAWGMAIDLNSCTGCSACVVACQAENNIPIVGKDQVVRGREMHWIRLDRYFKFDHDAEGKADPNTLAGVALQPVACMMCENAPCEQVCPVAATVHDEDGLNVMVYNRCIGTRYCSNNCPYKVRRFNYFDYHRRDPARETGFMHVEKDYYTRPQAAAEPLQRMQFNPEVTVRTRGVMEKCTYCVQRITTAKIDAKNEWAQQSTAEKQASPRVTIADGTITPACAQACPAQAIVFGDLNDSKSRVAQMQRDGRSYEMLEELNVKARTKYLAKLRNPAASTYESGGHHDEPAHDQTGDQDHG